MREDFGLCTRWRHHQQKLVLFLSAMRHFAGSLDRPVTYRKLDPDDHPSFLEALEAHVRAYDIRRLHAYEPADRGVLAGIDALPCKVVWHPNPGFLTSRTVWEGWRKSQRRLHMADFYRFQRRRLNVLLDEDGSPIGEQWSFDADNRKPVPRGHTPPFVHRPEPDAITLDVIERVGDLFSSHPGRATDFQYPVDHAGAEAWLASFLEDRFSAFGDYEDAISAHHAVLYHSVLSPLLNTGLLTPGRVLESVLATPAPLNAKEGFVRQLIGWREFIRGVDREYEDAVPNALGHTRWLTSAWWQGGTGLAPLDATIRRIRDYGWCHHIERLMVVGAAMLMAEVHPAEAYRWFMEMFVDSADWVMRPNVLGMSQFADGGRFATKPYFSASAYLRRMSDHPPGEWCTSWDGLYWRFVDRHRDLLARNPRMSMAVRTLDRMDPAKRRTHFEIGQETVERLTMAPAGAGLRLASDMP